MATFGKTSIGASKNSMSVDNSRVSKFTLPEAGSITKLTIYVENLGAGGGAAQVFKGLIYDDDGASANPGTLKATSDEISLADGTAAGWVDLTFAAPVALLAGDYYLGFIAGATNASNNYYWDSVLNSSKTNLDTYSDGPEDPFFVNSTDDRELSIYATYTPSAATVITRVTSQAKFGSASLEVTTPGSATGEGCAYGPIDVTAVVPDSLTESVWVKAPANATLTLEIVERLVADAVDLGVTNTNFVGTGDWQRVIVTRAFGATGVIERLRIYTITSAQAITFYVDGSQLESGAIATPYIETDGVSLGADNAEIRLNAAGTKGLFTPEQGWIAMRIRMGWASADQGSSSRYFFSWNTSTTNCIQLGTSTTQVILTNDATAGAAAETAAQNKTWTRGQVITVIGAWVKDNFKVSADGAAFTASGVRTETPALTNSNLRLGVRTIGSGDICGDILWAAMGSGTLTNADAARIHAFGNNKPDWFQLPGHPTAIWDGIGKHMTKIHG